MISVYLNCSLKKTLPKSESDVYEPYVCESDVSKSDVYESDVYESDDSESDVYESDVSECESESDVYECESEFDFNLVFLNLDIF